MEVEANEGKKKNRDDADNIIDAMANFVNSLSEIDRPHHLRLCSVRWRLKTQRQPLKDALPPRCRYTT